MPSRVPPPERQVRASGFPDARRFFIGISHKMYLDVSRTQAWCNALADMVESQPLAQVDLAVLPSLPSLPLVAPRLAEAGIALGCQDLFYEDRGAFTGGISGKDLRSLGCDFAEIGHAERRSIFGETDTVIQLKVAAAIRNDMTPLLCIGEPSRSSPLEAIAFCTRQLEASLDWLRNKTERADVVVAYEPVWAIGKSETADSGYLNAVMPAIRSWLEQRLYLESPKLIYGGSAKVGTLPAIAHLVDGLFLGRFAHDLGSLDAILKEASALAGVHVER